MPDLSTNGPSPMPTRFYVSNPSGANLTANAWNTIRSPFIWQEDAGYPNGLASQFKNGTFTPAETSVYFVVFQIYTAPFPVAGYAALSLLSGGNVWRMGPLAPGVPNRSQVAMQFSGLAAMSAGTGYAPAIYLPTGVNPKLYDQGHAPDSNYLEIMRVT